MDWSSYFIAIMGSVLAGIINTLAGNGSAITLTILTEVLQLPSNLANGTNRVGILAQGITSTSIFYKNDKLHLRERLPYIVPTIIGAIGGVLVAIQVSSDQFYAVFRILMVFMLIVILIRPKRWLETNNEASAPNFWVLTPLLLVLGFYGGFIQMGMGIFFIATMVLGAKLNIIDANIVKVFVIMLYTFIVLAIFHWRGLVDWKFGFLLAFGQIIGAWMASNFVSKYPQANFYAYVLMIGVIILSVAKLFNLHHYLLIG